MRERKAARLLVISPSHEVLLFRFVHKDGALAGRNYWATPGGGLEHAETFQAAAIRELREETGIQVETVIGPVAERQFSMLLPSGETVLALEQYFVVHAPNQVLSSAGWTVPEAQVMAAPHWWSAQELRSPEEQAWPAPLAEMAVAARLFTSAAHPSRHYS
ncbi:NUDIX hydrolase, partial [Colwellia sp. TT2012]|uniref:NUDIX hydrolase n=1 Tax=Colwellia sp. TT2012 TaxID=1720342 RepID=UPI0009ECBA2D